MEFLRGTPFVFYLTNETMTKELSRQLIEMFDTFEILGFIRLDHNPLDIFVYPNGNIKAVDCVGSINCGKPYKYKYP